jgi:integrase
MAKVNRRQHGEGSVYRRKSDGRWVAAIELGWRDGKRDRRYFYGLTSDQAIEARTDFVRDRDEGFERPKGRIEHVDEWMWHWLNNIAKVRRSTKEDYESIIRVWIVPHLGRLPLDELTEEDIERLYDAIRAKGRAENTVRNVHAVLRRALKVAAARHRIKRNPVINVEAPSAERPVTVPPTRDEVAAILELVDERRNGSRWSTGLAVGPRQGEALGLMWPYVHIEDLDNAEIEIAWEIVRLKWSHGCSDPHACGARLHRLPCPMDCPKAQRKAGRPHKCIRKGDKRLCRPGCTAHARVCPDRRGGGLVLEVPKSKKSRRTIPIPRPLAERLRAQRVAQARERLATADWAGWAHDPELCDRTPRRREIVCPACRRPMKADLLVWAQPNGRPIDPRHDWQEWADLLEELGLDHYRVHDGRHSAGSALLELGADVRIVQEILGHTDIHITEGYTFVTSQLARSATSQRGDALWPTASPDSLGRAVGRTNVHKGVARQPPEM